MDELPLSKKSGTALVLSGGATKAFYFHLGVLNAIDLADVSSIVGSSAGSIIGAFIAAGASVDDLITSLYQKQVYMPRFDAWVKTLTSTMLFRPNYRDITRQSIHMGRTGLRFLSGLPRLYNKDLLAECLDWLMNSQSEMSGFFDSVALEELFKHVLPSSHFSNTVIDLYIIATALDSRKRAIFNGCYDFEDRENSFMTDVPLHRAVRASSAVPGMFDPVKIKGNYYIDGEVKRTLSADIGVNLADRVIMSHTYQPLFLENRGSIKDLGWLNILKQSATMILHERIERWRESYEERHPEKEIIWIQPDTDDLEFFTAPEFSFRPEVQKMMIERGERAARRAIEEQAVTKA